ncbi:MAG: four helix bundle protein [Bacteroidota bacterium]
MRHPSEEKKEFVEQLKKRIKKWVLCVLGLCERLPINQVTRVINYQLIKSATSTGANHRAACRSRSRREFFAKLSIALEEADESQYWLELIRDKSIPCDQEVLSFLLKECDEILRILSSARNTVRNKKSY